MSLNRTDVSVTQSTKMDVTHPDVEGEPETLESGFCSIVELTERKL